MIYKRLLRPFLFLFDPEFIHGFTFFFFRCFPFAGKILSRKISWKNFRSPDIPLFNMTFRHEVGIAGGLDKNAAALRFMKNIGFAFMEIGTVTPLAQKGNPRPRLFRLTRSQAFINRMGFNNDGLHTVVERLKKRPKDFIIGGNIGKNIQTPNEDAWKDYLTCFAGLYDYVDLFIVNVSCPNIKDLSELQNRGQLTEILMHLIDYRSGQAVKRPILLKISPDLSYVQLDEVIEVVKETRIDGLVATNTSVRRMGLAYSETEIASFGSGGLSGKPLSALSTDIIAYLHKNLGDKYPIIASGGIMSADDAIEKINAGAKLIQLYTGFVYEGPGLLPQILKAIHTKKAV
ncbi:MAG: quinone-dependent dihydroorotate dehydrogenase [Bacteroidales bacterium]